MIRAAACDVSRMIRGLFVIATCAALTGCKAKDDNARPPGGGSTGKLDGLTAMPVERPKIKIDGPSVTPVITSSITFAVPKDAAWWGELAFSCYAAAINMQPGNSGANNKNPRGSNCARCCRHHRK